MARTCWAVSRAFPWRSPRARKLRFRGVVSFLGGIRVYRQKVADATAAADDAARNKIDRSGAVEATKAKHDK